MATANLFHRGHYNILAAQIAAQLEITIAVATPSERRTATSAVVCMAIRLAKRLKEDNPRFDPYNFLRSCSPNPDLYPLEELWEES